MLVLIDAVESLALLPLHVAHNAGVERLGRGWGGGVSVVDGGVWAGR